MIQIVKYRVTILLLFVCLFIFLGQTIYAQTVTPTPTPGSNSSDERKKSKEEEIKQLEQKVEDLRGQSKTLSNQISAMDSQIKLTQLRISATEQQIEELTDDINTAGKKISKLETSLTDLTKTLAKRIVATYQTSTIPSVQVLLTANNFSDFLDKANYLKIVQAHDKELVYATEQAKQDYANQKNILEGKKQKVEELKTQLEGYTKQIESEKASKNQLLRVTQNDEAKYQSLLSQARAEYAAIQGIIAGNGTETLIGQVSEGAVVAHVISGASGCSSGTHLHFEVHQGGLQDPSNYLSNTSFSYMYNDPDGVGRIDPRGSWNWPLHGSITISQGFGMTPWARNSGAYGGGPHTGIDMYSTDAAVYAVKPGKLYRGSYGGCRGGPLLYSKVVHDDGIESYYLHTYP
jgi:peptidoglycan hydrolase CwlO-like protein